MNRLYEEFIRAASFQRLIWSLPPHCLPQRTFTSRLTSRRLFQNKNCAFYLLSFLPPGHKGDIPFVVISQVLGVLGQLDSLTKLGRLDLNRLLLNIVCLHNSEKALVSNLFSSIKRAQVRATDEPEIVLKGQLSRFSNNTFSPFFLRKIFEFLADIWTFVV